VTARPEVTLHIGGVYAARVPMVLKTVVGSCIAVCLVIAWYGFSVTLQNYLGAERDVRSFDAPRWMIVGWIPLSFLMMAIEFARFLWRGEDFLASFAEQLGA